MLHRTPHHGRQPGRLQLRLVRFGRPRSSPRALRLGRPLAQHHQQQEVRLVELHLILGTGGDCPPRHPTHVEPSSLELNGTL